MKHGPDPSGRDEALRRLRDFKMARSVHAYVRGNTAQFYRWLTASPAWRAVPSGPAIWICGDCHLGNLGPTADADGRIDIQIRDLDQTVIGNPALDLIRLGLSLETAARSSDLPGITFSRMIEAMTRGYADALADDDPARYAEPDVVRTVRKRSAGRRWSHLAEEAIAGTTPDIPLGKRFWRLTREERDAIEALFDQPDIRQRTLDLSGGSARAKLRVVDAAFWRKGCSSLGNLRYAVLLGVKDKRESEYFGLVDIKEAVASVIPAKMRGRMPRDPADRVVAGATALAPNLGERMIAARFLARPVVLRELKPQDLKLELEQFSRAEAVTASAYLANVVGRAHARQLSPAQRAAWRDLFLETTSDGLDAPCWLWRIVVDLAAQHEGGYLDHCRRYAGHDQEDSSAP